MRVYFCLIGSDSGLATMSLALVFFYHQFQKQALNLASICPLCPLAHHINLARIRALPVCFVLGFGKMGLGRANNTVRSVYIFQAAFTLLYNNLTPA